MKKLILASGSPRRIELLKDWGIPFEVDPADIHEKIDPALTPKQLAMSLAEQKALCVGTRHPNSLILGADTIGVLEGKILGKPTDRDDAIRMLQALSGKTHSVITGFTLINTKTLKKITGHVETRVTLKSLTLKEIEAYVDTGEPMDKAAAYAIQEGAAKWVGKIEGDYNNVVGLPLKAVREAINKIQEP